MKTRVISAAILLPLLLVIVLALPKIFTAILFGLAAALGAYELLYSTGLVRHMRLVIYSMVTAFAVSMWSYYDAPHAWALVIVLVFVGVLFGEMMVTHVKIRLDAVAICIVGGLLVPYFLTSLVRIHGMYAGRHLILIPFILSMLSDSGAYFVGRAFGRHKLAPVISPHKTVEGAIGGVVSAVVGMMLYCLILRFAFGFRVSFGYGVLYGLLGSAISMFGDLVFSVIKRQTGIKDYGNLIPGHGGILDRFDSTMFVGVLVEALILMIPVAIAV